VLSIDLKVKVYRKTAKLQKVKIYIKTVKKVGNE
jgi:hypothetical protein